MYTFWQPTSPQVLQTPDCYFERNEYRKGEL